MAASDIGIDLGTASILVYAKGKGIVLKEPSVVAYDKDNNKIRAVGEEARQMIGRTPGNIVAVRPLRQGLRSDRENAEIFYFQSHREKGLPETQNQHMRPQRNNGSGEESGGGSHLSGGSQGGFHY